MCLESYGLSAPGMAWDVALKMTKVKLELFTNVDMYSFIERSIRGGVSQISKRDIKTTNKKCHDYDPLKPITHLIYLDANNLYGWATKGFRWLTQSEIRKLNINDLTDDAEDGYIYEVDLRYPTTLHTTHNC